MGSFLTSPVSRWALLAPEEQSCSVSLSCKSEQVVRLPHTRPPPAGRHPHTEQHHAPTAIHISPLLLPPLPPLGSSWLCLCQVLKTACRFERYTALRPLLKLAKTLCLWRPTHLSAPSLPAHASTFQALAEQLQPLSSSALQVLCSQLGRGIMSEYLAAVVECPAAVRQEVDEAAARAAAALLTPPRPATPAHEVRPAASAHIARPATPCDGRRHARGSAEVSGCPEGRQRHSSTGNGCSTAHALSTYMGRPHLTWTDTVMHDMGRPHTADRPSMRLG